MAQVFCWERVLLLLFICADILTEVHQVFEVSKPRASSALPFPYNSKTIPENQTILFFKPDKLQSTYTIPYLLHLIYPEEVPQ